MTDATVYKSSFNRDNLYYEIRPKKDVEKEIIRYIRTKPGKSGIIYCLSRKKVEEIAELLQGMWFDNLGFTIQLTNEEWALFQVTRTEGDYDIARGGWLTDFMDPSGMLGIFTQGNAYNDPDYNSTVFEGFITAAAEATTSAAHFDALYDAHAEFMSDMPVIPIYHYNDSMLVKAYVKGWGRSVLGGVDFSTAYIEK